VECRLLAALLRRIPQGEDFVFVPCFGFRISDLSAKHHSVSLWLVKVYIELRYVQYAEPSEQAFLYLPDLPMSLRPCCRLRLASVKLGLILNASVKWAMASLSLPCSASATPRLL